MALVNMVCACVASNSILIIILLFWLITSLTSKKKNFINIRLGQLLHCDALPLLARTVGARLQPGEYPEPKGCEQDMNCFL